MVTLERFGEVLRANQGKRYAFGLGAAEVSILHGLISLAMEHPDVQKLGQPTLEIARSIRDWCVDCFVDMGFSPEEVEQLDTLPWEKKTNEISLVRVGKG